MTSLAFEAEAYSLPRVASLPSADEDHLGLMIAIVAPLSASLWLAIGWYALRLSARMFGQG